MTYLVARRLDPFPDGTCTGLVFIPFPIPQSPGPLVGLTTSPAGAGAAQFDLQLHGDLTPSGTPDGTQLDVEFRLIEESPNANGTDLRTGCVKVTTR